jgi:hypothetical protein
MTDKFDIVKLKFVFIPIAVFTLSFVYKDFINLHFINSFLYKDLFQFGILDILTIASMLSFVSWEAIYEKKYVALIKIITISSLLYFIVVLIGCHNSDLNLVFLLQFVFNYAAIYGLIRPYFLKKRFSMVGYLIGLLFYGFIVLYDKFSFNLYQNSWMLYLSKFIYSAITLIFYFYLLILNDIEKLNNQIFKISNTLFLTKKIFLITYIILYLILFFSFELLIKSMVALNINEFYSSDFSFTLGYLMTLLSFLLVGIIFTNLIIKKHRSLGYSPSWLFLANFIPIVNIYSIVTYLKNDSSDEFSTSETKEKISSFKFGLIALACILSFYQFYKEPNVITFLLIIVNLLFYFLLINKKWGALANIIFIVLSILIVILFDFNINKTLQIIDNSVFKLLGIYIFFKLFYSDN